MYLLTSRDLTVLLQITVGSHALPSITVHMVGSRSKLKARASSIFSQLKKKPLWILYYIYLRLGILYKLSIYLLLYLVLLDIGLN